MQCAIIGLTTRLEYYVIIVLRLVSCYATMLDTGLKCYAIVALTYEF